MCTGAYERFINSWCAEENTSFVVCDQAKSPNDLDNALFPLHHTYIPTYIHTPGHQADSRGHRVLRRLGQSRHLQCPSLGVLSPLREGGEGERKRGREEERERERGREVERWRG